MTGKLLSAEELIAFRHESQKCGESAISALNCLGDHQNAEEIRQVGLAIEAWEADRKELERLRNQLAETACDQCVDLHRELERLRGAIAHAAGRLGSLIHSLTLSVPDSIHVTGIKGALPDVMKELKCALSKAGTP